MKKYLYFATVAIAALAMTGCQGQGGSEPSSKGSIKMKYPAREIAIGDEIKVEVDVTPANTKVTYTSSDPAVASVTSFGLINGLEEGNTVIYAEAEGIGKDSMILGVRQASDLFELGGFTLWSLDKTTTTGDFRDSVHFSDGTAAICKLCPGEWHVWDKNLSFDNAKGSMSGAGYVMILSNVPTYIIDDNNYEGGKYNGYYVGTSRLRIQENATGDSAYMVKPGHFIDIQKWADLLDGVDTTLTLDDCIYDQAMHYIDYNAQKIYQYQAFVGEGLIRGDEESVMYKQNITWLQGLYGLAYDEEKDPETGETKYTIRRPAEAMTMDVYYENWEEEEEESGDEQVAIKRYVRPYNDVQVKHNVKTLDRFVVKK